MGEWADKLPEDVSVESLETRRAYLRTLQPGT